MIWVPSGACSSISEIDDWLFASTVSGFAVTVSFCSSASTVASGEAVYSAVTRSCSGVLTKSVSPAVPSLADWSTVSVGSVAAGVSDSSTESSGRGVSSIGGVSSDIGVHSSANTTCGWNVKTIRNIKVSVVSETKLFFIGAHAFST